MKHKILFAGAVALLMAGCAALEPSRAVVHDGVIQNPGFGYTGYSFAVPAGIERVDPAAEVAPVTGDLQLMARRIYDLNAEYHPRGNESFYESFLMQSERAAFVLITVRYVSTPPLDAFGSSVEMASQMQLMPLYNIEDSREIVMGRNRQDAFLARGQAYESNGWYYAKPKAGRMPFRYEACKIHGMDRDHYILMGFCLQGDEEVLTQQMQQVMHGLDF